MIDAVRSQRLQSGFVIIGLWFLRDKNIHPTNDSVLVSGSLGVSRNHLLTCFIGIRLIDGVICPSIIKLRELCDAMRLCELDGVFELESAECGDGEPPFNGFEFSAGEHDWSSSAVVAFVFTGSLCIHIAHATE